MNIITNNNVISNTTTNSNNIKKKKKNVVFNEKNNVIHIMYVWPYASRNARKGHWESIGRDNARFKRMIENKYKNLLEPILTETHRQKMYKYIYGNNNYIICNNK